MRSQIGVNTKLTFFSFSSCSIHQSAPNPTGHSEVSCATNESLNQNIGKLIRPAKPK